MFAKPKPTPARPRAVFARRYVQAELNIAGRRRHERHPATGPWRGIDHPDDWIEDDVFDFDGGYGFPETERPRRLFAVPDIESKALDLRDDQELAEDLAVLADCLADSFRRRIGEHPSS